MRGPTPIDTLLGSLFKEDSKEVSMFASNKEAFWKPSYLRIDYGLVEI
jgi:hypothetical protein